MIPVPRPDHVHIPLPGHRVAHFDALCLEVPTASIATDAALFETLRGLRDCTTMDVGGERLDEWVLRSAPDLRQRVERALDDALAKLGTSDESPFLALLAECPSIMILGRTSSVIADIIAERDGSFLERFAADIGRRWKDSPREETRMFRDRVDLALLRAQEDGKTPTLRDALIDVAGPEPFCDENDKNRNRERSVRRRYDEGSKAAQVRWRFRACLAHKGMAGVQPAPTPTDAKGSPP